MPGSASGIFSLSQKLLILNPIRREAIDAEVAFFVFTLTIGPADRSSSMGGSTCVQRIDNHLNIMENRNNRAVAALPLMLAELAVASWETVARRSFLMMSGTCSLEEYHRMAAERSRSLAAVAWSGNRERQASSTELNSVQPGTPPSFISPPLHSSSGDNPPEVELILPAPMHEFDAGNRR